MRLALYLARCGVASRRESERLIQSGAVTVNGLVVKDPAHTTTEDHAVSYKGSLLKMVEKVRVWQYYKPVGMLTTHNDPQGRPTVFSDIEKRYGLPRVVSIGRLDFNSEGLLLLTNYGPFARFAEHPSTKWPRRYRVRIFGRLHPDQLIPLTQGLTLDGMNYAPMEVDMEGGGNANQWLFLTLYEGKNREIRKVMEHLGCRVNRLIRVAYGAYELGSLKPHEIKEGALPKDFLETTIK
jgi:23S rRNA pseudouridine2605 synthase